MATLDAESLLRLQWHILLVLQWEILPELERLRDEKNMIVKNREYEKAAGVRNLERLLKMLLKMLQEAAL